MLVTEYLRILMRNAPSLSQQQCLQVLIDDACEYVRNVERGGPVMTTVTINAPYIIDADELWSRVWGASPEAAGSHIRCIEFVDCDWDRIGGGLVHITMEHPDDDGTLIERGIVLTDIVAALSDLTFPDHLRQEILDDNTDCISADAVIQHIVYGEIVFS